MSQTARSVRLFRSNLAKFAKGLVAVQNHAQKSLDASWVWETETPHDVAQSPPQPTVPAQDVRPLVLQFAPEGVAQSGSAYARWCIFTAALSFQVQDPKAFLLRLATWWGDGAHPQHAMPSSEVGWEAVFGENDVHLEARKVIFSELLASKTFQFMGQSWEEKVAMSREFNDCDAINLAKLFPKSFADPFLNKACRAIWQFTTPYTQQGQPLNVKISGATNPMLLAHLLKVGFVECNSLVLEKLETKGFLRDEVLEQAVRGFLVFHVKPLEECLAGHSHEWMPNMIPSQTTDY